MPNDRLRLEGSLVALVTPFRDGRVDETALARLVERQLAAGTAGLVPCGTTGEAPTLGDEEFARVVGVVVETAARRVPVVAGTGTNDTAKTVLRTRRAREIGADAALVVVPYYNKPSQEGLYQHFARVAGDGGLPVVLYDVPLRTGVRLQLETIGRLVELPAVVAVKDATGDIPRITEIAANWGDRLSLLSGDDALTLPILAVGGRGVVSVTANVVPGEVAALVRAALAGDAERARAQHHRLRRLDAALFLESNPIPVKAALAMMGLIEEELRLPLVPLAAAHRPALRAALADLGVL